MKLRYPVAKHILPHHAVNFLGCTRQIGQIDVSANSCLLFRSVCIYTTFSLYLVNCLEVMTSRHPTPNRLLFSVYRPTLLLSLRYQFYDSPLVTSLWFHFCPLLMIPLLMILFLLNSALVIDNAIKNHRLYRPLLLHTEWVVQYKQRRQNGVERSLSALALSQVLVHWTFIRLSKSICYSFIFTSNDFTSHYLMTQLVT